LTSTLAAVTCVLDASVAVGPGVLTGPLDGDVRPALKDISLRQ
jgi:hypothetical protein